MQIVSLLVDYPGNMSRCRANKTHHQQVISNDLAIYGSLYLYGFPLIEAVRSQSLPSGGYWERRRMR